ncbi:hypothetical protein RvY_11850 [Ramazzottius varieornatus]|uniref:Uncharacterized protein n=1 Tax=Ramazzottius varieornatus TaxID=947166 RepID=A0A1D1VLS6_RAMVA|nr:hypothetical protein RvY_11850 [Ramazzottius varieornatus]
MTVSWVHWNVNASPPTSATSGGATTLGPNFGFGLNARDLVMRQSLTMQDSQVGSGRVPASGVNGTHTDRRPSLRTR